MSIIYGIYDKFDFIWASPPCHTHSQCNNFLHFQGCRRYPDMGLWQLIIYLMKWSKWCKIDWVVENVEIDYELLIKPAAKIGRHYFWSNYPLNHRVFKRSEFKNIKDCNLSDLCKIHKIDKRLFDNITFKDFRTHDAKRQILRNCIRPEIGKYILDSIIKKRQTTLEVHL